MCVRILVSCIICVIHTFTFSDTHFPICTLFFSLNLSHSRGVASIQLVEWSTKTSDAELNNGICWNGSLYNFSEVVLPACEHAIDLSIQDKATAQENGDDVNGALYSLAQRLDSRGLAYALTGNNEKAIADFQVFVDTEGMSSITARQKWIETLQKEKILLPKRY